MRSRPVHSIVYVGQRDQDGIARVLVETSGGRYPLRHIVAHSPRGLDWGHGGSGPADLALSILAHAIPDRTRDKRHARAYYDRFKRDVIAKLRPAGFRLPLHDVLVWLAEHDQNVQAEERI